MEAFIHFLLGFALFAIGSILGYWSGFKRGGLLGYQQGASDMETSLFDELVKLRNEGKL